jgi:xylose isomerase
MPKLAVITGFLGKTKDRFHDYGEAKSLEEKLDALAGLEGYSGAEIVYPYEAKDAAALAAALSARKLSLAAVNVNVKAEPEFRSGGLTSPRREVRERAVRFIKEAKDFALAAGADKVTCCPLGDGYEFAFQYDYSAAWRNLVDSFGEAAAYRPEMPLFIEYKPSETRGKCFIDTAAKTLLLAKTIGGAGLGVTLDFGHSIYGGMNPAEEAALVMDSGYPVYVHINDNDGKWDWDYFCGTKHYLEYVELLAYLKRAGYAGWFTSDSSPTRWEAKPFFEANARLTNAIWAILEQVGEAELRKRIGAEDYMATWRWIETEILGIGRAGPAGGAGARKA